MKIALLGYGKMGKAIEAVIHERNETAGTNHEILLKIDHTNVSELTPASLGLADVAIEFSTPFTAYSNILKCFEAGVPVVAGTTGWLEQLPEIKERISRGEGTLMYGSNFSVGVNIFFEINRKLAALMAGQPQYEVAIHEVHHTEKLDAPSGTAITLGNDILAALPGKKRWVNHASVTGEDLPIFSYREPGVPGTHTVQYESPDDSIEIIHKANSRKGFAQGAVIAAEWLVGKKGYFEMRDLLGL